MKNLIIIGITSFMFLIGCAQQKPTDVESKVITKSKPVEKEIVKIDKPFKDFTDADWKKVLTPYQYEILRQKGTERPFTSDLLTNKKKGTYICAGCKTPLYKSETKFKSGTGWPSFYDEISNNVKEVEDNSYGMSRTEIVCSTCDGHLGHVFNDGPKPTGLRHCVNGVSLEFKEAK